MVEISLLELVGSLNIKICASFTPVLVPESGVVSEIEANCQRNSKNLVAYLKYSLKSNLENS